MTPTGNLRKSLNMVSSSTADKPDQDSIAPKRLLFLCNFPDCDQSFGTKRDLSTCAEDTSQKV